MEFEQLQRAIEAILFAAGERMEISRLSEVLEVDPDEIEKAADAMADEFAFQRRGIRILKLEKGYQMVSSGEMADFVTKALETRKKLIEEAGRLNVPGRPIQYRTTPDFLRTFGLSTLEELPPIDKIAFGEPIELPQEEKTGEES